MMVGWTAGAARSGLCSIILVRFPDEPIVKKCKLPVTGEGGSFDNDGTIGVHVESKKSMCRRNWIMSGGEARILPGVC